MPTERAKSVDSAFAESAPDPPMSWFHEVVDPSLQPLTAVLDHVDDRLRSGPRAAMRVWPTGFELLDRHLGGGFRSGELILLAGPQGLGKTTWALQVARNVARGGRPALYCSFEHDQQTLLVRLVALEAGLAAVGRDAHDAPDLARVRAAFESSDGRTGSLADRVSDLCGGDEAMRAVGGYAERLILQRATGTSTTLDVIRDSVEEICRVAGSPLLVVDYLQKVRVRGGHLAEDDRVTLVVEGLKDVALDLDVPVLAISAADRSGLAAGKRMRVNNLRGSTALAYEADTVLIFNNKFDVVARHHLMYDLGNAERFKEWSVLSIEKNRSGKDGIDLEFRKCFEQGRFDTDGRAVAEQLVDERIFVE